MGRKEFRQVRIVAALGRVKAEYKWKNVHQGLGKSIQSFAEGCW